MTGGWRIVACLALALAVSAAVAQEAPAPPCTTGRVVQVQAPGAVAAAMSDRLRLLVFGHAAGAGRPALTVLPLNAAGLVVSGPSWRVPPAPPDSLRAHSVSALGVAFHPTLPLLYVWRDTGYPGNPPKGQPDLAYRDFDHLAVYAVSNGMLTEAGLFARGTRFAYGQGEGRLAVDPGGRRLFLPNLRAPATGRAGLGYVPLRPDGMPLEDEGGLVAGFVETSHFLNFPTGRGFHIEQERVVVAAAGQGFLTWDTDNRLASLNRVLIRGWLPAAMWLGGHAAVPSAYAAGGNMLARVETADGYPTLLPSTRVVPDAVFQGPPVVLTGAPARLAVGGVNAVYLVGLDRVTGVFRDELETVPVTNDVVRALAVSDAFNRLYVAVEGLP